MARILYQDLTGIGSTLAAGGGTVGGVATSDKFVIYGYAGNDTITGGDFYDQLFGGIGNDNIDGGLNNDRLYGEVGDDILIGGAGNDSLIAGAGADNLTGSTDTDVFDLTGADVSIDTITDWGNGADVLSGTLAAGGQLNVTMSNSSATAFSASTAAATNGKVSVTGGTANDVITGGAGDDTLIGGAGIDQLTGGAGNDSLKGGTGNDTFNITAGIDTINALGDVDLLIVSPGATANTVLTTQPFPSAAGSINDGTVNINVQGNLINLSAAGGAGGWTLTNTGVAASMTGSNNADTITGGTGADTIVGGVGSDSLTGGAGADKFTYTTLTHSLNTALDQINDYVQGMDLIDVTTVPTTLAAAAGTGDFTVGTVAASGTDAAALAVDIATYMGGVTVADAFGVAGDIIDLQITGNSIAGSNVHYLLINDAVADYLATSDAIIALVGTSNVPTALADFV